jgi:hypothetical protein
VEFSVFLLGSCFDFMTPLKEMNGGLISSTCKVEMSHSQTIDDVFLREYGCL